MKNKTRESIIRIHRRFNEHPRFKRYLKACRRCDRVFRSSSKFGAVCKNCTKGCARSTEIPR